jgi:hypothetical protein
VWDSLEPTFVLDLLKRIYSTIMSHPGKWAGGTLLWKHNEVDVLLCGLRHVSFCTVPVGLFVLVIDTELGKSDPHNEGAVRMERGGGGKRSVGFKGKKIEFERRSVAGSEFRKGKN